MTASNYLLLLLLLFIVMLYMIPASDTQSDTLRTDICMKTSGSSSA